jgi:hypothetical protein
MNWFDRIAPVLNGVVVVCALYVAVIFGQFIALLIQDITK